MVEWKKIGEVIDYLPGGSLKRNEVLEEGRYPVMNGGVDYSGYYDEFNYDQNVLTISHWGSSASHVHRHYGKFWANNACWVFVSKDASKYALYYLYFTLKNKEREMMSTICFGGATPNLNRSLFEKIEIPIPSISEQQRIVDQLDTFTSSIENLKEQIALRRKQYAYNLDKLFDLEGKEGVQLKCLGRIGKFVRGKRFVRTDIVEEGVPCLHYGDFYTTYGLKANETKTYLTPERAYNLRFAEKYDVVIVAAGENNTDIGVGVVWLGDHPAAVHDACYIFRQDQNPMYISYFLRSSNYHQQIKKHVSSGKICSISADGLAKAVIPIPDLFEQQRIVSILDTFEVSIQNLEAQLKQREKQYEYYRNKLLTFE